MTDFLTKLRAANIARNVEWDTGDMPLSLVFRANELAGEVGEACNVLKKFDREFNYKLKGSRDSLEHLAEELSDIVICCDLLGMSTNISFNERCWPLNSKNTLHDYSIYGAMLAQSAGRICGIAIHFPTHINTSMLTTVLHGLMTYTKIVADRIGIDLDRHVANKFNATSHKVGLTVLLDIEAVMP